jgi:hypothetical protein
VIEQKEAVIEQKELLLNDPDFNKRQAMLAFNEAEAWRQEKSPNCTKMFPSTSCFVQLDG